VRKTFIDRARELGLTDVVVCANCGLRVVQWYSTKNERGWVWAHRSGGQCKPSCGKVPIPRLVKTAPDRESENG
jgi:hypothetical protein